MTALQVNLPTSLHHKLQELADLEGISTDQFVATSVAEMMSALLTEDYLNERARRGSREKYDQALSQVPDIEPEAEDRIE